MDNCWRNKHWMQSWWHLYQHRELCFIIEWNFWQQACSIIAADKARRGSLLSNPPWCLCRDEKHASRSGQDSKSDASTFVARKTRIIRVCILLKGIPLFFVQSCIWMLCPSKLPSWNVSSPLPGKCHFRTEHFKVLLKIQKNYFVYKRYGRRYFISQRKQSWDCQCLEAKGMATFRGHTVKCLEKGHDSIL